jgi:predicted AlkP superfamily pyrophosphatase or phosphodiesterase
MMTYKNWFAAAVFISVSACTTTTEKTAPQVLSANPAQPKLVVMMMVDGLPMEQLYKHQDLFVANGFRRFMDQGAWYADAHQAHAFTLTAPGHAAVATGAYSYQHGIIGNEWRERDGKYVYNTSDPAHKYLDGTETTQDDGTSPKRLQASTIADELGYATNFQSRTFTVSGKDRGAILLAGKTGKAFMYSTKTGRFTSTGYYMEKHPQWWESFYTSKPQDKWFRQRWNTLLEPKVYERSLPDGQTWSSQSRNMSRGMGHMYGLGEEKPGRMYYGTLLSSPFGDEATVDFALTMMKGEGIGANPKGVPDMLGISFSGHDYINHQYGPESVQSQDHLIRLDREIARFFDAVDASVGRGNVLAVLTADHGFVNAPESNAARRFDAARIDPTALRNTVNALAEKQFGIAKVATQHMTGGWTLDYKAIAEKKLSREEVEDFVTRAVIEQPGIAFAYSRTQLTRGTLPNTRVTKLAQRAWNQSMAVDVMIITKPFFFFASPPRDGQNPTACTHGSPYGYDTHVPLMWHGPQWIKPGRVTQYGEVVDIAPTLAALLRTRMTSGNEGRVLGEILR